MTVDGEFNRSLPPAFISQRKVRDRSPFRHQKALGRDQTVENDDLRPSKDYFDRRTRTSSIKIDLIAVQISTSSRHCASSDRRLHFVEPPIQGVDIRANGRQEKDTRKQRDVATSQTLQVIGAV